MTMKVFVRSAALASILLAIFAISIDRVGATEVTVGRFIQDLAQAKHLDAQTPAEARAALADLDESYERAESALRAVIAEMAG